MQAIETGFGYGQWLHGEAVAIGTVCHLCDILYYFSFSVHGCCLRAENNFNAQVMAVEMSHRLGWIDESLVKRVHNILKQARLPTSAPESMTVEMFKSIMSVRLDSIIYS